MSRNYFCDYHAKFRQRVPADEPRCIFQGNQLQVPRLQLSHDKGVQHAIEGVPNRRAALQTGALRPDAVGPTERAIFELGRLVIISTRRVRR